VDSVNGGYALRTPVDAVNEFRILTLNAPAEYGDTSGATTSVVTKSGGNYLHGDVYDFFRNDAMDARNFFAAETEPLHRNQYGATVADLSARTRFLLLLLRRAAQSAGETQAAIVPPPRSGRETSPDSPTPPPGSPFPSSTSLPASRSRATRLRRTCRARSLYWRRSYIRYRISAPTYLNPPSLDRITTTKAASASITTSAERQFFARTPHRRSASSTRCRSPEPASLVSGHRRHCHELHHWLLGPPDFPADRADRARLCFPQCVSWLDRR